MWFTSIFLKPVKIMPVTQLGVGLLVHRVQSLGHQLPPVVVHIFRQLPPQIRAKHYNVRRLAWILEQIKQAQVLTVPFRDVIDRSARRYVQLAANPRNSTGIQPISLQIVYQYVGGALQNVLRIVNGHLRSAARFAGVPVVLAARVRPVDQFVLSPVRYVAGVLQDFVDVDQDVCSVGRHVGLDAGPLVDAVYLSQAAQVAASEGVQGGQPVGDVHQFVVYVTLGDWGGVDDAGAPHCSFEKRELLLQTGGLLRGYIKVEGTYAS